MKTQISVLTICVLFILLLFSCNDKSIVRDFNSSSARLASEDFDSLNNDGAGKFLYEHLKKHLAYYDPYDLMPEKDRAFLKAKLDSAKNSPNKGDGEHWDEALRRKIISQELHDILKGSDRTLKQNISAGYGKSDIDSWFSAKINEIKSNRQLNAEDKQFASRHLTLMRYAIRTCYETVTQPKSVAGGRLASSNCTVDQITCAANNITIYSGVGALFPGPGEIIGAIVGALVSIGNCPCDSSPCQYAVYVSTPDVCYDQYAGLTFKVAGYGNAPNGFRFELYKSDNLSVANQIAVHATSNNSTTFSNSELQGNSVVYIYVATNCGSGSLNYQPTSTSINIPYLGQPSFTMTGQTNPYINSYQGYNLVGRNIQNTAWHIYTYGPTNGTFINQYSQSATVQWNSTPGYVHITADASTDCGTYNNGLYVTTHN